MPVFNNILAGASGATSEAAAFQIDRSLRFNDDDSAYLSRTPSTAGNRKTWTWSGWVKRSKLGAIQYFFGAVPTASAFCQFAFNSDDTLRIQFRDSSANANSTTNAVFRDPSAWYHIVFYLDTTQATASNRMKLWVNGVEQTFSTDARSSITQNGDYEVNNTSQHVISSHLPYSSAGYVDGYLADVHFIDGQALAATDFGEYDDNGVWQPKKFGGSYFTSVSTATGALPIHNTSGTFGGTKVTGNRTDPNASNLVLAISGSGSYQDISATIKGSGTNKTVTANGNVTTSSSEGKYYGGGSLELTGSSGDYFSIPNSSDFAFGTGDFTVEFWIKTTDTAFNILDITAGGGWSTVLVNAGAQLFWQTSRASTNLFNITTNSDLIDGAWHHVAFVRSSNVVKPYLDGVQIGTSAGYTDNTDYDVTTGSLNIGSGANGVLDGYMQDIRIYKGVAKYTSNFTVSAPSNSFHLDFSDNTSTTTIAEDSSGSDNDWTANNLIVAASVVSDGNPYSVGWAGLGTGTWANSDSWDGLSEVSNNAKGYFPSTENLSDGSTISVANGSFGAGSSGSNGWVLRASSTVTIDFTVYPNITEIATTSSDTQTFADRTVVATNPTSGSSLIATGKCFWFKNASQMSVSQFGTVNNVGAGNDSLIDTPSNYTASSGNNGGNYCTWNPLCKGSTTTLSNGNLDMTAGNSWKSVVATIGATSGKWYWEQSMTTHQHSYTGICN